MGHEIINGLLILALYEFIFRPILYGRNRKK